MLPRPLLTLFPAPKHRLSRPLSAASALDPLSLLRNLTLVPLSSLFPSSAPNCTSHSAKQSVSESTISIISRISTIPNISSISDVLNASNTARCHPAPRLLNFHPPELPTSSMLSSSSIPTSSCTPFLSHHPHFSHIPVSPLSKQTLKPSGLPFRGPVKGMVLASNAALCSRCVIISREGEWVKAEENAPSSGRESRQGRRVCFPSRQVSSELSLPRFSLSSSPLLLLRSSHSSTSLASDRAVQFIPADASDSSERCNANGDEATSHTPPSQTLFSPRPPPLSPPSSPSSSSLREASSAQILAERKRGNDVQIHPSAVVHPDAILMEGVEVGPFCTVGPFVTMERGCRMEASSHVVGDTLIGEECILRSGAIVGADIPGKTILGRNNKIGYYAVVGVQCQDLKYKEGSECFLEMGSHNDIREYTQIHRSSKSDDWTIIGDRNLIMGSCHVAHDCKIGHGNILANGTLLAGHVIMHDFIHTGGAAAVHQFCQVGSYAFIAAGSMVVKDVPMYTMVAGDRAELRGLNLEGLRRRGFSISQVRSIRRAYQKLFLSTDATTSLEDRLQDLEESELGKEVEVGFLLASVRASFGENRRGICSFRNWTNMD